MIIDGKRLSEAQRLKLAADEEHAALEAMVYEYPNNALIAHRLSIHTPMHVPEVSSNADTQIAKVDAHSDKSRSVEPGATEALLTPFMRVRQAW